MLCENHTLSTPAVVAGEKHTTIMRNKRQEKLDIFIKAAKSAGDDH
jgi:hypothetical protein